MSDGQSDIFGQKGIFGIGRKSDEKSDESRTKVGQKDKNDLKPFNITVRTVHYCKTKYKMSPSSVRSEGGEAAAGYCLNSVSYRVDE